MQLRNIILIAISLIVVVASTVIPLWPKPLSYNLGNSVVALSADFQFIQDNYGQNPSSRLSRAIKRYQERINKFYSNDLNLNSRYLKVCTISVKSIYSDEDIELNTLDLNVNEGYSIDISMDSCVIKSDTIWGSFHALETFIQLLVYKSDEKSVIMPYSPVTIVDMPRYSHRGLLIDTSRHFLSVPMILSIIDILPISKFNTLHWHIVDAESFPFQSPSEALLVKGAYEPLKIYSLEDVKSITQYASDRGIRVIVEVDVPGHTGSWRFGKPEIVANCMAKYSNVENYALNPSVDDAYVTIQKVIGDFVTAQKPYLSKFIHLGGDETVYGCWSNDSTITAFMKKENIVSYNDLFNYFINRSDTLVQKSVEEITKQSTTLIHWEEVFFANATVPKGTVFQVWTDSTKMASVADAGNFIIASPSDYWYLNYVSIDWTKMYSYDPTNGLKASQYNQIIGGEACVWGELVDDSNIQATINPRLSAVGERLWSPQNVTDLTDAKARLTILRCRLIQQSFHSAAVQPDNCAITYV